MPRIGWWQKFSVKGSRVNWTDHKLCESHPPTICTRTHWWVGCSSGAVWPLPDGQGQPGKLDPIPGSITFSPCAKLVTLRNYFFNRCWVSGFRSIRVSTFQLPVCRLYSCTHPLAWTTSLSGFCTMSLSWPQRTTSGLVRTSNRNGTS